MGNISLKTDRKNIVREKLFLAQGGVCCYCGVYIYMRDHKSAMHHPSARLKGRNQRGNKNRHLATFEHLKKKSDGGTDRLDNLALPCLDCNSRRGDEDWLSYKTKMADLSR